MVTFLYNNYHRLIIILLLLLQIGFIHCYLPFSEWFNKHPIYTDDFSLHYADALYKNKYLSKYKKIRSK